MVKTLKNGHSAVERTRYVVLSVYVWSAIDPAFSPLEEFGKQFLPLGYLTSVTVRVDRSEQTVAYYVDGVFVGTAFGPEGSDAVVAVPLPTIDVTTGDKNVVYPAASIGLSPTPSTNPSQVLHT